MAEPSESVWMAREDSEFEHIKVELCKTREEGRWHLAFVDGPFSGYPEIHLNREQLVDLYRAIEDEIGATAHLLVPEEER